MTAVTETQIELSDYDGKRVELTLVGEDQESTVGTVIGASPVMLSFKEKGKAKVHLIKAKDIADIKMVTEGDEEMKPRRLNIVGLDKVKRHLVDRHGFPLAQINPMAPEDALQAHDELKHEGLSHYHADPPAKGSPEAEAEVTGLTESDSEPDY